MTQGRHNSCTFDTKMAKDFARSSQKNEFPLSTWFLPILPNKISTIFPP